MSIREWAKRLVLGEPATKAEAWQSKTNGVNGYDGAVAYLAVEPEPPPRTLRWRLTLASGRVLFVNASSSTEAWDRAGLLPTPKGASIELAPLEDEVVTMVDGRTVLG